MAVAKTPTVLQMEATECGAASLCMITAFYGLHIPLEQMRIETGVSRDGSKASNILKAARKFNFEAKGYKRSFEGLLQTEGPCIIHWNFNHFVVYEGTRGKFAYINDPAMGKRKLTLQELDESYTGIVLTFTPTENFQKVSLKKSFIDLLKKRLAGEKKSLLSLIAVGLLLILPGALIPAFSAFFVDQVLAVQNNQWLHFLLGAMFCTLIFSSILNYYRKKILIRLRNKKSLLSTYSFINHLFRLPMGFFSQRYSADIANRIDNNESVNSFLYNQFAETILNVFVALFYFIILAKLSVVLALIGLVNVLFNSLMMKLQAKSVSNLAQRYQQDFGKLAGSLSAGISLTSTLKASGAEARYMGILQGHYAKMANVGNQLQKKQESLSTIPEISGIVSSILVLMIGALFVIDGSMTAGTLLASSTLLASFMSPMNDLLTFYNQVQTLKADLNRVDDIESYPEDETFKETEKIHMETKLSGRLELRNISYGYNTLEPALVEDFCFKLSSGQSIALVGSSGSGKSTVSKIVSGLFAPWNGEMLCDDIPVSKIPQDVLSASISTVSQQISLFNGTIRDNLTMWNSTTQESDILQAAKDACIHDMIISKPGAYDFKLAEGGANISGGERQRLEIARALVKNPTILILDEATSALDPITEKKILDNIKRRGCTCLIVAHRLSTIRDADEILVMEHGKIIQRGNHESLVNAEGTYQALVRSM